MLAVTMHLKCFYSPCMKCVYMFGNVFFLPPVQMLLCCVITGMTLGAVDTAGGVFSPQTHTHTHTDRFFQYVHGIEPVFTAAPSVLP